MKKLASVLAIASSIAATVVLSTAAPSFAGSRSLTATAPCGVFTGTVLWGPDASTGYDALKIVNAHLSDTCSSGYTSVWLTWDTGRWITTQHHNARDGVVGAGDSIQVSATHQAVQGNPSHIGVTVCSHYNGWHCGATIHM
jgi:hypothetical protein